MVTDQLPQDMWSLIVVTMSSQIRFELCDCTVVVMWSLNCDHFLWSQFVVTILLFFCSGKTCDVTKVTYYMYPCDTCCMISEIMEKNCLD